MASRKRSEMWNYFESLQNFKAKCNFCSQIVSVIGGSTGNLSRHMRTKHVGIKSVERVNLELVNVQEKTVQPENSAIVTAEIPTTSAAFTGVASSSTVGGKCKKQGTLGNFARNMNPISGYRQKEFDTQLIKMIVKEYHPFSIVDDAEFRKFVSMLCPGYRLPSRKTISNTLIPMHFNEAKQKVLENIKDAFALCITTDGWTSINNDSYVAVTAHWINADIKLCSNLLDCVPFNQKHTAENLKNLLLSAFETWDIQHKICAVVTDNAANVTAAIREGGWRHIACFAHSVNLIAQASIKEIVESVEKVKRTVEYFKRSTHALARLREVQVQMGLPEIKLKQDVPTRWNSTFDMIERFLKIKDAVVSTMVILGQDSITFLNNDWTILKNATEILNIFNEVTIEISSEKQVSISKILIFIKSMKRHVLKFKNNLLLPQEVIRMAETLYTQIFQRFKDIENHCLIREATLLDPRFKKYGFSDSGKANAAIEALKRTASKILLSNVNADIPQNQDEHVGNENVQCLLWSEFDEQVKSAKATSNPQSAAIVEVDKYMQESIIPRTEDPLLWWKTRQSIYPRLFKIVLKRLCIVATSVPCERIFSKTGLIASEKRSRLTTTKLSKLIFLNQNLE